MGTSLRAFTQPTDCRSPRPRFAVLEQMNGRVHVRPVLVIAREQSRSEREIAIACWVRLASPRGRGAALYHAVESRSVMAAGDMMREFVGRRSI